MNHCRESDRSRISPRKRIASLGYHNSRERLPQHLQSTRLRNQTHVSPPKNADRHWAAKGQPQRAQAAHQTESQTQMTRHGQTAGPPKFRCDNQPSPKAQAAPSIRPSSNRTRSTRNSNHHRQHPAIANWRLSTPTSRWASTHNLPHNQSAEHPYNSIHRRHLPQCCAPQDRPSHPASPNNQWTAYQYSRFSKPYNAFARRQESLQTHRLR